MGYECHPICNGYDNSVEEHPYCPQQCSNGTLSFTNKADCALSPLWTEVQESEWVKPTLIGDRTMRLLYRGSEDGFDSEVFHQKCDGLSPTLTVARSKVYNRVFGGYTEQPWKSDGTYGEDTQAFLFSVTNQIIYEKKSGLLAVQHNSNYGPMFLDLRLKDGNLGSYDTLGNNYGSFNDIPGDLCCKPENAGTPKTEKQYF